MNREAIQEQWVIDDMRQWSAEKMYGTFGPWLERVVNERRDKLQLKLKTIWRNRKWYAWKETGEQFEGDTMLCFFDPKKIKKYSLSELESIVERVGEETNYSNPKSRVELVVF